MAGYNKVLQLKLKELLAEAEEQENFLIKKDTKSKKEIDDFKLKLMAKDKQIEEKDCIIAKLQEKCEDLENQLKNLEEEMADEKEVLHEINFRNKQVIAKLNNTTSRYEHELSLKDKKLNAMEETCRKYEEVSQLKINENFAC